MGGLNQLRGYDFREFFGSRVAFLNLEYRFPLVDYLIFPFGGIRDLRAFLFMDVGAAWGGNQNDDFFLPDDQLGNLLTDSNLVCCAGVQPNGPFARRTFQFWDSKHHELGDGRGSYGFGWDFYLGPFQLTWAFARQLPNSIEVCDDPSGVCGPGTTSRIDNPFRQHGTVSSFYIAREF